MTLLLVVISFFLISRYMFYEEISFLATPTRNLPSQKIKLENYHLKLIKYNKFPQLYTSFTYLI
jgi:hypothetical protein